jgi:hypothetical protein
MARGDWPSGQQRIAAVVPIPLVMLINRVQNRRCFDSRNATIKWLLETHPLIDEIRQQVYADAQQDPGKPGPTAES